MILVFSMILFSLVKLIPSLNLYKFSNQVSFFLFKYMSIFSFQLGVSIFVFLFLLLCIITG